MSCAAFLPTSSPLWHGMIAVPVPADPLDDRIEAVVAWVEHLLQEAAEDWLPCPRCGRTARLPETLSHLLATHEVGFGEAAAWLEATDADLYTLAVHFLVVKCRAVPPAVDSLPDTSTIYRALGDLEAQGALRSSWEGGSG